MCTNHPNLFQSRLITLGRSDPTGKLPAPSLRGEISCHSKARGRWEAAVPVLHIEQRPAVGGDPALALWGQPGVLNPLQKALDVLQVIVFLKKGKAKAFITG